MLGRRRDRLRPDPLPGVVVSLGDVDARAVDTTATGADGLYTLKAPGPGRYMLKAELVAFAPLVRDGRELVPNVTPVVSAGQHLYFYYEVYEPAAPVKVLTSIAFFRGRQRAFETPMVQTTELGGDDRKTAVFQFDVPASSLPPGLYTCQVNVVDDAAGSFTFPRLQLLVRR